jgi:hypothetical protein
LFDEPAFLPTVLAKSESRLGAGIPEGISLGQRNSVTFKPRPMVLYLPGHHRPGLVVVLGWFLFQFPHGHRDRFRLYLVPICAQSRISEVEILPLTVFLAGWRKWLALISTGCFTWCKTVNDPIAGYDVCGSATLSNQPPAWNPNVVLSSSVGGEISKARACALRDRSFSLNCQSRQPVSAATGAELVAGDRGAITAYNCDSSTTMVYYLRRCWLLKPVDNPGEAIFNEHTRSACRQAHQNQRRARRADWSGTGDSDLWS